MYGECHTNRLKTNVYCLCKKIDKTLKQKNYKYYSSESHINKCSEQTKLKIQDLHHHQSVESLIQVVHFVLDDPDLRHQGALSKMLENKMPLFSCFLPHFPWKYIGIFKKLQSCVKLYVLNGVLWSMTS